jgi:hypothetical protein
MPRNGLRRRCECCCVGVLDIAVARDTGALVMRVSATNAWEITLRVAPSRSKNALAREARAVLKGSGASNRCKHWSERALHDKCGAIPLSTPKQLTLRRRPSCAISVQHNAIPFRFNNHRERSGPFLPGSVRLDAEVEPTRIAEKDVGSGPSWQNPYPRSCFRGNPTTGTLVAAPKDWSKVAAPFSGAGHYVVFSKKTEPLLFYFRKLSLQPGLLGVKIALEFLYDFNQRLLSSHRPPR